MFHNLYQYRFLLREIVRKNIKLQYRGSILGVFWTFLQPLLTVIVLIMVFGNLFGRDLERVVNYPIYLLCGRLIYEFYSQATKRAMRSIFNSASVIKKVYVPKYIYPIANTISNFVTFAISLLVLAIFMIYYYFFSAHPPHITPYIFLAWVPLLILFIMAIGIGLILSIAQVFFRDVEYFYDVFCMLLFYLTPVFYDVKQLKLQSVGQYCILLNPLYSIVTMFRDCVLFGTMWNWHHFLYATGFALAMLGLGILVFWKKQDKLILHL